MFARKTIKGHTFTKFACFLWNKAKVMEYFLSLLIEYLETLHDSFIVY